ncbi:MAG: uracil-DNA glycosylase [Aminivibrio sp.]
MSRFSPLPLRLHLSTDGEGGSPAASALEELRCSFADCRLCPLREGRKSVVFGEGPSDAGLLLVGEAPGATEDETGRPFTGRSGKLLASLLEGEGLPREKVFITNMVKCRPPKNRAPTAGEMEACRPLLAAQVAALRPRLVVTVGNVPTRAFLSTKEGITGLRGRFYDCAWEGMGLTVRPVFHPSYLLRNRSFAPGAPCALTAEDIREILLFLA